MISLILLLVLSTFVFAESLVTLLSLLTTAKAPVERSRQPIDRASLTEQDST